MRTITMSSPERVIAQRPLGIPDTAASQEQYGVEWGMPTSVLLDEMGMFCDRLVTERDALVRNNHTGKTSYPESVKPAILYVPSWLLMEPLSPVQRAAVDQSETPAIAAHCVEVQSAIATVPIVESFEPLRHLPSLFADSQVPAHFAENTFPEGSGEWSNKPQEFWARTGFAERLVFLGKLLRSVKLELDFIEAFRPPGVQEAMFKRRLYRTRTAHPNWNTQDILDEAKSKTASTPRLASHKAGAAVDIMLRSSRTQQRLDFGHDYPDGGAIVFPRTPFITAEQWLNRQKLQVAVGLCGLTMYLGEDWHVSYGDNLAGLDCSERVIPGYRAKYGPVKAFDRHSGEVTACFEPEELDQPFSAT